MYFNGAGDDPVEKMPLFLDSTTLLLFHDRSFPCAVSMLLLSYIFSSACLEIKSDTTLAWTAGCHSVFSSRNFSGRWELIVWQDQKRLFS